MSSYIRQLISSINNKTELSSIKTPTLSVKSADKTHTDRLNQHWQKNSLILSCIGITSLFLSGCNVTSAQNTASPAVNTQQSQSAAYQQSGKRSMSQMGYTYGSRPFYLIDDMDDSPLKTELKSCEAQTPKKTDFSISHRGAPLQYPEHTFDGYMAAARMGAGVLECDVAFTKDHQMVCRHAQNDLHTTTNILTTKLADRCTTPPKFDAKGNLTNADSIECRTSNLTLDEFKSLKGKMDAANTKATTLTDYMNATAPWRTELYNQNGQVMTLKEHIALAEKLGMKHTPELKAPTETMPFGSYTQDQYRQQLIDTYKQAGVNPNNVYAQSFDIEDIKYWIKHEPTFAKNAVYLIDDSNETSEGMTFDKNNPKTWKHSMQELKNMGVNIIAPATWLLVTTDGKGHMMSSEYAKQAKQAGLKIITWSIERSGPLVNGGGWYYTGLEDAVNNDGDIMNYIDVLAQDVGVMGIFSDWPATVTYYANCKGL